jgi:transcriptional regulator with XRE-family HTH domain/tetratricopeptide (TPR) repeat protein
MTRAEQVGERVRERRYRRGMTQAQLAVRAGVGEKTIARLEAGKTDTPHPETLAAVAGALGVAPADLLDGTDAPEGAAEDAPAPPALHQLPRAPANFTGREREIAELGRHLAEGVAVLGIHGMGGVGKTALALVVAERSGERFPDGQFYFDLRGTTLPVPSTEAMLHVIRSVEPERPAPKTDAGVAAAYRSVLRGKRTLLLLDNAVDREQVEPLLPPDGSVLLVTSRQRFTLPGLRALSLEPLDGGEAARLVQSLAPRAGEVGATLADLCGGLPLALSLAGRALAERPDLDPVEYAARLADDQHRLAQLDAAEAAGGVEASFALSYGMLDEASRAGLCALSVFQQHFDRSAAAAVWDLSEREADPRVGTLVRFHLMESSGAGAGARYRLHDLVRLFAAARLGVEGRALAGMRYARHYLALLERADRDLRRGRQADAESGEGFSTLDREWAHVTTAFAICRGLAAHDGLAAELCLRAADAAIVLRLRLDPEERIGWFDAALTLARGRRDRAREARILVHMARAHQELGEVKRAIELCQRALDVAVGEGERGIEAFALVALGDAHHAAGDPAGAFEYGERALALSRDLGARAEEAGALVVLAWGYRVRGELARAIECCEQALPIAREFRDRTLEASALLALGFAHQARGKMKPAREYGSEARRIAREIGDRRIEGYSLIVLGEEGAGPGALEECLAIASETGDRRMTGNGLLAIGLGHAARGRSREAMHALEGSLAIAEETGDRSMEGIALIGLGISYTMAGDLARAIQVLARDEDVSRSIGNRPQEAMAAWLLGCAYELTGALAPAVEAMERAADHQASEGAPGLDETRQRIAALRARLGSAG